MPKTPYNPKQYDKHIGPEQPKTVHYDPNQYDKPIGPARPTPYQKIVQKAKDTATPVKRAANVAYDVGAQAKSVGHEIGQNPYVKHNVTRSGFTTPVNATPRHPQSRQQYQGAPVDEGSVMHPGNTTYIIKCQDGKCEMKERKQREQKSRAQRRQWATGGLGGIDPGFL